MHSIRKFQNGRYNQNHIKPHVIQTRGVAARNAPSSALPPITDFSKDVTEEQEVPRAKLQHLSLPKDVNIDALIIGDSITNRVNGNQVGSRVVARGFGGQTTSMLLDRTSNTKARKVSQVFIFIGINDCLSPEFDVNVSAASYEKLIIYTSYVLVSNRSAFSHLLLHSRRTQLVT